MNECWYYRPRKLYLIEKPEEEKCKHEWIALRPTDISEYRTKVYCKYCCETKFINYNDTRHTYFIFRQSRR